LFFGGFNFFPYAATRGFTFSLATNRIDAERNEHDKSRMSNFTERLFQLDILSPINPAKTLDHLRLSGSGSRPLSKLWQAPLQRTLYGVTENHQ